MPGTSVVFQRQTGATYTVVPAIINARHSCDVLRCMWQLLSRLATAVMYSAVEDMLLLSTAVITMM